jgi:hypothetical protein
MSKSKFAIQTYGKSEFAMMLFPDIDSPKVAQAKLLRWIKRDPELYERILSLASSVNDNDYSPEQIRFIINKFGAPGEYDAY